MAALESPVTLNRPINEYGLTSDEEAKIFTTEKNYRLTPTEQEYFVIRKMKEEQRLKGNLDLETHLGKIDQSFEMEDDESTEDISETQTNEDNIEDLLKREDENISSIDDLLDADK